MPDQQISTKYDIGGKVRLVVIVKECEFFTIASFKALYKIFAESDVSTRCENPAKVRLVGWFWAPPGAKSGVKCAW